MKNNRNKVWRTALIFFSITFLFKSFLIYISPEANTFTDISCLVNGGQMLSHGINPYDFNDNVELRTQLRLDSTAYNEWLCSDPAEWNYHSGNNLPFNLLLNGFIDLFADGNVYGYRMAYNFADSLIGVFVVLFTFGVLNVPYTILNLLLVFFLGGASPQLIVNGTMIPEDKGIQILFMVMAVWFSYRKQLFPAALFLSFSVGFKAIGIFIAPLCLYYYLTSHANSLSRHHSWKDVANELFARKHFRKSLILALLSIALFLVFYLPYASDFYKLMLNRLDFDLDNTPLHASLWRLFHTSFPDHWLLIRQYTIITLIIYTLWLFVFKNLTFELFITSVLLIFTCVILITGSLDRCNMAIQFSTILFFLKSRKIGSMLAIYYIFGSLIYIIPVIFRYFHFHDNEWVDFPLYSSYYVLGYCILYFISIFLYCRDYTSPIQKTQSIQ